MRTLIFTPSVVDCPHPLVELWKKHYEKHGDLYLFNLPFRDAQINCKLINEHLVKMFDMFDTIVVVDVDEYLIPDPDKYKDLTDFLEKNDDDMIVGTGYEVIRPLGRIDYTNKILSQCKDWWYYHPCSKPVILRKPVTYVNGKHYTEEMKQEAGKRNVSARTIVEERANPELKVVHLKRLCDNELAPGCRSRGPEPVKKEYTKPIPNIYKELL